jgi:hypothetical protein
VLRARPRGGKQKADGGTEPRLEVELANGKRVLVPKQRPDRPTAADRPAEPAPLQLFNRLRPPMPSSAKDVLALYDRRMTAEEQFRDTKGRRFGGKLVWTHFRDPEALARLVTLLAVALLIWTMTGIVAADLKPSLRLRSRRKGPRQSFVTIGIRAVAERSFSARFDRETVPLILEAPTMRSMRLLAASKCPLSTASCERRPHFAAVSRIRSAVRRGSCCERSVRMLDTLRRRSSTRVLPAVWP